ncbi:4Fe-4S dicluster domain-containing protein [Fusibacter paucivorans]|uniref:4Fe-4S dicluster domain-containing protein n=1 Tax=Fusibacter paucivorans TaxID=76009 RepID=A0ABS5PSY2_9FIRM|nr:4Fe-4S dicluster domain-containing protein [Fusibacter paucivorans]MBS7527451.1 4Fe-4S dicluster domain-containing protein [Fusibacter paucivorans]
MRIKHISDGCIGCMACVVACKEQHLLPVGVNRCVIEYHEEKRRFIWRGCRQCKNAPCEKACDSHAVYTAPDGTVVIDRERCTGCGKCIAACPFHVMAYDERAQQAVKCDTCYIKRTTEHFSTNVFDNHETTACVAACPFDRLELVR